MPFLVQAQQGASSCAELEANFQQYQSCATSVPFTNSTGNTSGETFNTTCIGENFHAPTWFFMKIKTSGTINLQIKQFDNAGTLSDVDFVLWGPFSTLTNVCGQLNVAKEVDCSWSPNGIENVTLPNAVEGELYILLVDNYANVPGEITIAQTGGDGSSDCSFLSDIDILDDTGNEITQLDYCAPGNKNLVATVDTSDFTGNAADLRFNYKWFIDDVEVFAITDSTAPTNTYTASQSGTYRVEMTAYDITDPPIDPTTLVLSTDEITLQFYEAPVVSITTTAQCLSASPQLQASNSNPAASPVSFQWFRDNVAVPGAISANFSPTQSGVYFARATNPGCTPVDSSTITIYPTPAVAILDDMTICEDDTYQITSSVTFPGTGFTIGYQWYKGTNPISGANGATYTVSAATQAPATSEAYSVQVTLDGLCENTSNSVTITLNKKPALIATPVTLEQCDYIAPNNDGIAIFDLTQAAGEITGNDPDMVLAYYLDPGLTMQIVNPSFYTNSSPFNETLYVTGMYPAQTPPCTSTVATLDLVVNPTSVANYPDLADVCPELNQTFGFFDLDSQRTLIKNTYFPATNVTIMFYGNATDASVEVNPLDNTSPFPVGNNTVFARIETGNDCEGIGTFSADVYAAPLENSISVLEACESDPVILSVKDGEALSGQAASVSASYFPSFDAARDNVGAYNKNSPIDFPVGTTPVYVRLFDSATGCRSVVDFDVIIYKEPVITAPDPLSICGGTSAPFDLDLRIAQITGGNTNYQVSFFASQTDLDNGNAITPSNAFVSGNTTVLVLVADPTQHNCTSQTTLSLSVSEGPGALVNPDILQDCDDSGFHAFDLTQHEAQMVGTTPATEVVFFYYENPDSAEANGGDFIVDPVNYTNTIAQYQKIYVRLNSTVNFDSESGRPCYRILEQELFIRHSPADNLLKTPYHICVDKDGNVVSPALIDTGLSDGFQFAWYTDFDAVAGNELSANQSFRVIDQPGEYSVKIVDFTNTAHCTSIINFTTRNTEVPFSVVGSPADLIAFETDNTITAIVMPLSNDYEYQLDNNGWQESNVFTDVKEGMYRLTVRSKYGCGEVYTDVAVSDYPRFFTPNGDGIHDTWNIDGQEAMDMNIMYIFDRNGRLIRTVSHDETGWDGTYNGRPLPADDYWFVVEYVKGGIKKEFRGHFTLKR